MASDINQNFKAGSSPKKRVLFIITQSEIGGAQQFLHTLVNYLGKTKYEILIAAGPSATSNKRQETRNKQNMVSYELLDKLELESFAVKKLKYLQRELDPILDLKALFELRCLIKEFRPDILFLLSSKAGFIGSLTCRLSLVSCHPKVIYRIGGWTFNDPWPAWKKKFWIILERWSARWKDMIIVNNKHDFDQAQQLKIRPRRQIILVHNGIDAYKTNYLPGEEARLRLFEKIARYSGKIFQADTLIGTIANFYPPKGLGSLIETAGHFKNNESIAFVIIGDGPERANLEKSIRESGLEHRVFLLGNIPDAKKYLPAFDIFVLPSLKEGFPFALIEAMAAKLPVIATRVGAVPEIINDGKNGFIVESGHPEQIVARLREILVNDYLRKELGIQAHQTVLFNFSLDKTIGKVEELLDAP